MNSEEAGERETKSWACKDWLLGSCTRDACRFQHEPAAPYARRGLFRFCHDYQNRGCVRANCKFVHCTLEEQEAFLRDGLFPQHQSQMSDRQFDWPSPRHPYFPPNDDCAPYYSPDAESPPFVPTDRNGPSDEKKMRYLDTAPTELLPDFQQCSNCTKSEHTIKLLHENYAVLLKKFNELKVKNTHLTTMNEFLLEQSSREREGVSVMTPRSAAPVSLATVSVTPVVSLSELVPAAASAGLALEGNTSRAQLLTQASQLLAVSTTQPLMTNSGALIVTSTGAHQLMQASTPAALVGGGQAMVAVAPAQLVASPSPATVQQLVQHSAQLAVAQQSAQQLAVAQQSAQHLQQSAQHLAAAQQSVKHLPGAHQSAQHLQKSAQHLAAAQHSAQQLAASQQTAHLAAAQQTVQHLAAAQQSAQQLVHASSAQITISSVSSPITQTQLIPMISQSMLPH